MTDNPTRPAGKVRVVRNHYQPSKAELEEPVGFPEGTTPDDLAKAVTRTVVIERTERPE